MRSEKQERTTVNSCITDSYVNSHLVSQFMSKCENRGSRTSREGRLAGGIRIHLACIWCVNVYSVWYCKPSSPRSIWYARSKQQQRHLARNFRGAVARQRPVGKINARTGISTRTYTTMSSNSNMTWSRFKGRTTSIGIWFVCVYRTFIQPTQKHSRYYSMNDTSS